MFAKKGLAAALSTPAAEPLYVEDVFSTYLYTGNDAARTITNGIDLSGESGMVWLKSRTSANSHFIFDTSRGATYGLSSNTINGQTQGNQLLTAFNSNGFSLGDSSQINSSPNTYASWSFRKAEKFFDVVTYTGNGTAGRTINHNLGSVPGCIIIKSYSGTNAGTYNWNVYHRSLTSNAYAIRLNEDGGQFSSSATWNSTTPTSTQFTLGDDSEVNGLNTNFVAYLFAHDAGGFGDAGDQSVISCGSYTGNGSSNGPTIDLGWEPQWVLIKRSSNTQDWCLVDNMRGMTANGTCVRLFPNTDNTDSSQLHIAPIATGFQVKADFSIVNGSGDTYIYIAIRRGPMKTPEAGTEVFAVANRTGASGNLGAYRSGFIVDMAFHKVVSSSINPYENGSRLTQGKSLNLNDTSAEVTQGDQQYGYMDGWNNEASASSTKYSWMFRRAPGFFDVVCYTGTGSNTTVSHNLGVAPEFIALKRRDTTSSWACQHKDVAASKNFSLNSADPASNASTVWNSTAATSSSFSVGTNGTTNASGSTYVAYLFASVTGVSKVGSYTGTGTTLQVNCGFTAGARFVLIKRTDDTGDWYVWDSARGIVSGNDPYLLLNSTAAEVTNTDYIDTYSSGFEISSTAPAAINANGGTFIYLAIA